MVVGLGGPFRGSAARSRISMPKRLGLGLAARGDGGNGSEPLDEAVLRVKDLGSHGKW